MTQYEFSCKNCSHIFKVALPDTTTRSTYNKCGDKDKKFHDLKHLVQCQNCDELNTIYYCIDSHPILESEKD